VLLGVIKFIRDVIRSHRAPSEPKTVDAMLDISPPPIQFSANVISPETLTCKSIMDSIENAPLLQQPDVAKHYIGLKISWEGYLVGASRTERGLVRLTIQPKDITVGSIILFDVDPSRYPGIGLLKQGDTIRVEGTIAAIHDVFIELDNARIISPSESGT